MTVDEDLNMCLGEWLLVGAMASAYSDNYALGAFVNRTDALMMALSESITTASGPFNGVYWYRNPLFSFGFADSESISLSPADAIPGDSRLSWHLTGVDGGYRAGNIMSLNVDNTWQKNILNCGGGGSYTTTPI
eukprot:gene39147-51535_t